MMIQKRSIIINNYIAGQEPTFTITDTKLYVSRSNFAKLLEKLKSEIEKTIDWNK